MDSEDELPVEEPSLAPGETSERLFQETALARPLAELSLEEPEKSFSDPAPAGPSRSPCPGAEPAPGPSPLRLSGRHVFILSDAGKPIYSRRGREEDFVTEMGALQAMLSTVVAGGEALESFAFGPWKWVFLERAPLILVAAARTGESESQLRSQLSLLHHEILSVLTRTQLTRIFTERRNFDLRRLLSGTEKALDLLTDNAWREPALLLSAVAPLPLPPTLRDAVSSALHAIIAKLSDVVFGLVIGGAQLITMVRMRRYALAPSDLHLLLALVKLNAAAFQQAESWLPICLPRFDDSGFLHAHISSLGPLDGAPSPLCLVLLSVDRGAFFALSEARGKLLDKLRGSTKPPGLLPALAQAAELPNLGVRISEVGLPGAVVWHFLYKNRGSGQLCGAAWEAPYASPAEQARLSEQYLRLARRVATGPSTPPSEVEGTGTHSPRRGPEGVFRIFFTVTQKEALLAWVTGNFELYAALSPVVSKAGAISRVDKLMKWLKKEEERLFILNPLVF